MQPSGATWSGATGTSLGTAANWQPAVLPDTTETLTFSLASGGTLTGSVTGMNAVFGGAGAWLLQGATVFERETLAPGVVPALTENGALTMTGGALTATSGLDVETATGLAMTVQGGAQVGLTGVSLGVGGGESGILTVAGAGTAIQNTGSNGSVEIGGSGSGQLAITGGASVTASPEPPWASTSGVAARSR